MRDLEVVKIEGNSYVIIKEVKHGNTSYLYLSNINDEEDTLIRKMDEKEKDMIIPLENDQEFELACNLLLKHTMI